MTTSNSAGQLLQGDDDLGFRPARARGGTSADDGLGFRAANSPDADLAFRPAKQPAPAVPTPPLKPFDTSAGATPSRNAIGSGLSAGIEKPYTAVPGVFGQPELSDVSKQRVAQQRLESGSSIGPGKSGVGGWLEDLEADIRHGTGVTGPGRTLKAMGAPGTESGVSPAIGESIGGPIIGPVRVARGLKQALGPYAGEPGTVSSELGGLNEALRGGMQSIAPALVTQPEALAALPAYGIAGEAAQRGLEKAGVSPEASELASNVALLGGGMLHGGIAEPKPEFGGVFERGAHEPIVAGDTAQDYLSRITQKTGQAIVNTDRLARINAPVEIPKLPETTERPPILSRPIPRTPMQDLSAQAAEARRPHEFRQQLTNEIGDQIISRLRDEGALEPSKTNVVDRRTVRPEDVEPYQPERKFIGGENIPPTVIPRADKLPDTEPGRKRWLPSMDELELGFRPASEAARQGRLLPPAGTDGSEGISPRETPESSPLGPTSIGQPIGRTASGILPGLESAGEEHGRAASIAQGHRLTEKENLPDESIESAAGTMERQSPLFRGSQASPQREMFPPRQGEAGFVAPDLARELLTGRLSKDAYKKYVADPIIEKGLGLGDKYAKIEEADPGVAAGLHLLDNAPAYFRAKAAQNIHNIVGDLSREQERLFALVADADSRENLRANHPDEYKRAMDDSAIQDAIQKYRPLEKELTAARAKLEGQTLDQDYLRRVYDEHVAGIGKEFAPGSSERGTTGFDRIIRPQKIGNMSREATAEYHYQNGLHEFGPAFGTKYIGTNLAALRDSIARDFISKATRIEPGDAEPRSINYNGEKYYRPDIAREMRDAGRKNVSSYDRYDPTAGVKYPQKDAGRFLGPQDVVRALNDYGAAKDQGAGPVRRFLQEQTIGFGFGIPHVANILRRVTQSVPMGAANPEGWVRAWQVAFGKELRERGVNGLDDPTFDRLMQQGSITTGEQSNLKGYWGGNLNPANWARSLAGIGHKVIFDPKSFGGFGGVDQRARLYVADLVRSQNPGIADDRLAGAVNTQLGDYNRANWNDRQKFLAKFMLFPGWDSSSIRWVIQHPIKTTVPPALLVWTANQILNRYGQNRDEDASDISNIHFGDRSIGLTVLRESMARNLERPLINYAQSRIRGENNQRALGEATRGITQAAGGLVGTLRPDLTAGIDLAMNRENPFGGKELVSRDDYNTPGRILPNRALEKQAALVVRHAIPPLDRMLGSNEDIDFASFAGSNLGVPNYKQGAEQRLGRNVGEAMEVSQTLSRLAKSNPAMARDFIKDPDNAAYSLFRHEFDRMASTLKRIDQARETINSNKSISRDEKSERLAQIDKARQNLLKNADGLDRLLFQRKQEMRSRGIGPPIPKAMIPDSNSLAIGPTR